MKLQTALLILASSAVSETFALPPVIDNSAYPPNAVPSMAVPATNPQGNAVFELMSRIEQMQAEMQQLTGKLEEQANQIAELKKKQSTMYGDFDDRLQSLENKTGAVSGSQEPNPIDTTQNAEVPEVSPESAPVPTEKPEPIDSPTNLAAIAQEQTPVPASASAQTTTQPVNASEGEKQDYQNAYTLLRINRTQDAIIAFKAYLQHYPNGGYATNAQYWLGEAYRVNKDTPSAQQAFTDVIEKYPNTAKVPDALLMLGIIEAEQKNTEKSKAFFNRVINEYPNTVAAKKAAKKLSQATSTSNGQ